MFSRSNSIAFVLPVAGLFAGLTALNQPVMAQRRSDALAAGLVAGVIVGAAIASNGRRDGSRGNRSFMRGGFNRSGGCFRERQCFTDDFGNRICQSRSNC